MTTTMTTDIPMPQRGDLYQLGAHYLLVDDCTDPVNLARLLAASGGERAHAIISDPPYGMTDATWDKKPQTAFTRELSSICQPHASAALFCALPYGFQMHNAMLQSGWSWRTDFVWSKNTGGFLFSRKAPIRSHELIYCYARAGVNAGSLTFNGYEAGEAGKPWGDKHDKSSWSNEVYGVRKFIQRKGREDGRRWIRSVLPGRKKTEMPTAERTSHGTQKCIQLVSRLVRLFSQPGEVVYDGFLGSGTTLLACELEGRRCIGCELEPRFAKIIIECWQKQTGLQALLLSRTPAESAA